MSRLGNLIKGLPHPTLSRFRVLRCSFCEKRQNEVQKLIGGPDGVYVCGECVGFCNEIIEEELKVRDAVRASGEVLEGPPHSNPLRKNVRCSFCGKSRNDVSSLQFGPSGICICNECVELCNEIIEEEFKWEDLTV